MAVIGSPAMNMRVSTPHALPTSVACRAGSSGQASLLSASAAVPRHTATRQVTRMGNKNTTGPFAPIVRLTRSIMGEKRFNSIRGQGISLHSQVIRQFITRIGGDNKKIQGLIKKAKMNGEKLGFLA